MDDCVSVFDITVQLNAGLKIGVHKRSAQLSYFIYIVYEWQ